MTESNHVGPIIFGNETARNQLVEEDEVVTFRTQERTTGDTWWRTSRTGPKEGDCHVELVTEVRHGVPDLTNHIELSGFESVAAWQQAIRDVHGVESTRGGCLYYVTEGHND